MASTERVCAEVARLDQATCQAPNCVGLLVEGLRRQFPQQATVFNDDILITNGDYHCQVAHYRPRDYFGLDDQVYDDDAQTIRRTRLLCTICHVFDELYNHNSRDQAKAIALKTIRSMTWIEKNGYDVNIPFDIFTARETREINKERRERISNHLERRLLELGGRVIIKRGETWSLSDYGFSRYAMAGD